MTRDIRETVERIKETDVRVTVTSPDFGPESLESFYDYQLAAFGCLRYLQREKPDCDGILLACFGDPGLYALKEISRVPVIGIAEASLSVSLLMGQKFSLLVASEKAVPMMKDMVNQYGLTSRLASIEPIGMSVLDVEENKEESVRRLLVAGRRALDHGAEVLILGCAGMTGLKQRIEEELGVPVIDPVECGYKVLEMMARQRFPVSKTGLYRAPEPKAIQQSALLTE